jgi:hypothetical protein
MTNLITVSIRTNGDKGSSSILADILNAEKVGKKMGVENTQVQQQLSVEEEPYISIYVNAVLKSFASLKEWSSIGVIMQAIHGLQTGRL